VLVKRVPIIQEFEVSVKRPRGGDCNTVNTRKDNC